MKRIYLVFTREFRALVFGAKLATTLVEDRYMRDFEEKIGEGKVAGREVGQKNRASKEPEKKPANSTDRAGNSQEKTCTVTDGEDG